MIEVVPVQKEKNGSVQVAKRQNRTIPKQLLATTALPILITTNDVVSVNVP